MFFFITNNIRQTFFIFLYPKMTYRFIFSKHILSPTWTSTFTHKNIHVHLYTTTLPFDVFLCTILFKAIYIQHRIVSHLKKYDVIIFFSDMRWIRTNDKTEIVTTTAKTTNEKSIVIFQWFVFSLKQLKRPLSLLFLPKPKLLCSWPRTVSLQFSTSFLILSNWATIIYCTFSAFNMFPF